MGEDGLNESRLKALRKKAGKTQQEVADEVGVHFTAISRWERGKDPIPDDRIADIAEALGVSEEDLTGKVMESPQVEAKKQQVRTSSDVNRWRDELALTQMDMYLRLVLAILPAFLDDSGLVVITKEQLIKEAHLPPELVEEHWPSVLEGPWVERVGKVEYVLKLVFPG